MEEGAHGSESLMAMGDQMVSAGQHHIDRIRAAELLVGAVVDKALVQAGDLGDVFVDDADVVGHQISLADSA